jgi:methionyl-tRNA formyltransferase
MQSKGFTPQDPTVRPLRTFPRRPEDARIDWRAKTADIFALIRASSHPFDGAFCTLEGDPNEKIVVFAAQPHVSEDDFMAMPGQVCFAVEGDPVIATGDGLLRLTDCRLNGQDAASSKKRITQSLRHRLS